jgi:hypothetical protein
MESRRQYARDTNPSRGRLQFRLRTVFIALTVSAIVVAGLTTGPERRAVLTAIVVSLCCPMLLAAIAVFRREYVQAFCVGALLSAVGMALVALSLAPWALKTSRASGPGDTMRFYAVLFLICSACPTVVLGLLAMGVRWLFEGRRTRCRGLSTTRRA